MATKYGWSGFNNKVNPKNNTRTMESIRLDSLFHPVRVKAIVLDNSNPQLYDLVGQENGIGSIFYGDINKPIPVIPSQIAKPLFPNIKNYPLINEIVYLISLPDPNSFDNTGARSIYYLHPINIWNHPHHNALPFPNQQEQNPSIKKDYIFVDGTKSVRRVTDQSTDIPLGDTFTEKTNIRPLNVFEGDIIHEGRWGNSIRFGSTVVKSSTPTPTYKTINQSYTEKTTFPSGGTEITPEFKETLSQLNNKVSQFKTQYPDYRISVALYGMESQVPNPPGYAIGDLAIARVNQLENTLFNYPLLDQNIIINAKVGNIPYTAGVNDPNDIRYTEEQFVQIKVLLQAKEETTPQATEAKALNNWSTSGNSGDPITIIRNGQPTNLPEEGWVHITEDINQDQSSIYLSSTQQIPLAASSTNYFSYPSDAPTNPDQYLGNQIILNSGRLVFNSSNDHILLSSAKSVSLSSQLSVNIDTSDLIVQSNKIYLGDKNATEPLLLGNSTVNLLKNLIQALTQYMQVSATLISTPEGTPLGPLNVISSQVLSQLQALSQQLNSITSKDNFTV